MPRPKPEFIPPPADGGKAWARVMGHDGAVKMGRKGARARWANKSPEQRKAEWAKGRNKPQLTVTSSDEKAELSLNCKLPAAGA